MRALSTGELKALRDNMGRWQIAAADLDDWSSMRPPTPDRPSPETPAVSVPVMIATPPDTSLSDAVTKAAAAEARADGLEARLADAVADRDHWRDLALRLSEARPVVAPVGLSLWDRLFGRR